MLDRAWVRAISGHWVTLVALANDDSTHTSPLYRFIYLANAHFRSQVGSFLAPQRWSKRIPGRSGPRTVTVALVPGGQVVDALASLIGVGPDRAWRK